PPTLYAIVHHLRLLFGFHLRTVLRLRWPEKVAYVRAKGRRAGSLVWSEIARRAWQLVGQGAHSRDPLIRTQRALDEAFDAYVPRPYGVRVTIFRATRQPFGIHKDPALGWNDLAPSLEVCPVQAYFTTGVYEPAVRDLAAALRDRLDDLDA